MNRNENPFSVFVRIVSVNSYQFLMALLVFTVSPLYAQSPYHADKKVVVLNNGVDYWTWGKGLADRLEKMQTDRPFVDGAVFHIGAEEGAPLWAFNREKWTEQKLMFGELERIAQKSTRYKDNFILVSAHARNAKPDFFDDALWSDIVANAELLGKAVKISGSKGIVFDAEFYSPKESYSPWWYDRTGKKTAHESPYIQRGQSFEKVKAKARQRGREYMAALQKEKPNITVMTLFLYSMPRAYALTDEKLPKSDYALLPAFGDGMLEALGSKASIIDGHEGSYYIEESRKYFEDSDQADYPFARKAGQTLCAPELLSKWNTRGQVAMAPYVDLCYNIYSPAKWRTTEYQSRWLQHNIYNSLLASDQYVWIYVEKIEFWTGAGTPPGLDLARDVKDAVTRYRDGKPLGYDMFKAANIYQYENDKQAEFISSPSITLTRQDAGPDGKVLLSVEMEPAVDISHVEFYVNSFKISEVSSGPYSTSVILPGGDAVAFARAFTKDGRHMTSAPLVWISK